MTETFGTLYGAFEACTIEEDVLAEEDFEGPWIEVFVGIARENIAPPTVDIVGQMEMMCPTPAGIERIKEALDAATRVEIEGEVKIAYVGAPNYRITVKAPDYKTAEESMKSAVDATTDSIVKSGGTATFTRTDRT